MLEEAKELVAVLPAAQVGTCVMDQRGNLFREGVARLRTALAEGSVHFHEGCIRGALPQFKAWT